jgi:hypothetical protein
MVLDHFFAFNTAAVLFRIDTYKFRTVTSEFYTILLKEVALEMLKMGICSSLQSRELTRVVQWSSYLVILLAREDAEVHLHAIQTMTEEFQPNSV